MMKKVVANLVLASALGLGSTLAMSQGLFVATLEGEWADGRTVVLEFVSEAEFRSWWESPEYQAIATDRIEGTRTHSVVLVHAPPWG